MSNLTEIQNQIAELQKRAQEIKASQKSETIKDIIAKMDAFDITIDDLDRIKGRARKSSGKSNSPAPVKYRGAPGETWSGRGLMPRWLKTKVDAGHNKEEFAV